MKPFLLQVGEVLVDRGERRQAESAADFLQARRVAVLLDEIVEKVENFPLALGQWQHARTISNKKRKSTAEPHRLIFRPRPRSNVERGNSSEPSARRGTALSRRAGRALIHDVPTRCATCSHAIDDAASSGLPRGQPRRLRCHRPAASAAGLPAVLSLRRQSRRRQRPRAGRVRPRLSRPARLQGRCGVRHVAVSNRRERLSQSRRLAKRRRSTPLDDDATGRLAHEARPTRCFAASGGAKSVPRSRGCPKSSARRSSCASITRCRTSRCRACSVARLAR